ncbi:ABC transporter ATP-binding protein [Candidatus Latescibacterota bacterium]
MLPPMPSQESRITRVLRVWSCAPRAAALVWRAGKGPALVRLATILIARLFPLAGLWCTKLIIDSVASGDADRAYVMVGMFAVFAGLHAAAARVGVGLGVYMESRIPTYANALLQEKINSFKGIALFEDPRFHDALENARRGANCGGILNMLSDLLVQICVLISTAVLLGRYHPLAPVLVFATAIPRVSLHYLFMAREWSVWRSGAPESRRMAHYSEIATGDEYAKEVRLFRLGDTFVALFRREFSELHGRLHRVRLGRAGWNVLTALCAATGAGAVYAYLAVKAGTGQVTVGDLVLYTGLLFALHGNLMSFTNAVNYGYRSLLDLSLYFEFMDRTPELPVLPEGSGLRVARPMTGSIALEGVSFTYPGTDKAVLSDIDLEIPAGQTTALVGANGAGKTTLVKLLTRLYDPTAGRILLDGTDLREYDVDDLRQAFGVVLQDFVHYHLTVRENIGFGQVEALADDGRLERAARQGGASEVISHLPEGLDTVLGREFPEGTELSGGEWQKVAISRGFMRDSEILILDEPTAALDARSEEALYERFAELVHGRTALFISHRLATVRMADRIAVLDGARLVELGSHGELMSLGGRYARLFTMQAERYGQ